MRNFRNYRVRQNAMMFTKTIYSITRELPESEKYSLARQMQRAAVSIASNFAEGCARSSEKDFKRFVEISLGSAYELETQAILSQELYTMSESDRFTDSMHLLGIVQAELNALRNTIIAGANG